MDLWAKHCRPSGANQDCPQRMNRRALLSDPESAHKPGQTRPGDPDLISTSFVTSLPLPPAHVGDDLALGLPIVDLCAAVAKFTILTLACCAARLSSAQCSIEAVIKHSEQCCMIARRAIERITRSACTAVLREVSTAHVKKTNCRNTRDLGVVTTGAYPGVCSMALSKEWAPHVQSAALPRLLASMPLWPQGCWAPSAQHKSGWHPLEWS
jgi:hypothetical protein